MSNGILQGAHHLVFHDAYLIDNSSHVEHQTNRITQSLHNKAIDQKGSGLERLLEASLPDAFHDSSARYPPPRCHPGTRQDYVDEITNLGLDVSQNAEHLIWLYGPAGVGKSAVAQSCAESLAEKNKLGAAFFLSRSNEWDNPDTLFPSISYQLTTRFESYGDIIDRRIRKDPTLVTKSIREQFQELLVKPLSRLRADGMDAGSLVIIVDGLDECLGREIQCDIVEIVAASIQEQTTPFRWIFSSRPETHLVGSFSTDTICSLSRQIELPVSSVIDNEIALYLTDELRKIQCRNQLPASWPTERDIGILVKLSAGLFIYAATIIRFVGDHNSLGPVDQLYAVLSLAPCGKKNGNSPHPLPELDVFYTLIMQRIPSKVLQIIQKILLLVTHFQRRTETPMKVILFANILGLSEPQFRNACGSLRSVLELSSTPEIRFYHASFLDFLQDSQRSGEYSVYSCLHSLRCDLLGRLNDVHAQSIGSSIYIDVTWPSPLIDKSWVYHRLVEAFFGLCQCAAHPFDPSTYEGLLNFRFDMIPLLWMSSQFLRSELSPEQLLKNIPVGDHRHFIRRIPDSADSLYDSPKIGTYILGHGEKEAILSPVRLSTKSPHTWYLDSYPTFNS